MITLIVATPGSALASTGQWFSSGQENDKGFGYIGLSLSKSVHSNFTIAGCLPIYEGQYVDLGGGDWVELGIAYDCDNTISTRRFYHGYAINWVYHGLGQDEAAPTGLHSFEQYRMSTGWWHFYVDGSDLGHTVQSSGTGSQLEAFLEVRDTGSVVPAHSYNSLEYTRGSGWVSWSGKDGTNVSGPVCGKWLSATSWEVAENDTC